MIDLSFLIPYSQEAGAGVIAWFLMSMIRKLYPPPVIPPTPPWKILCYQVLYIDDLAYIFVGVLTAVITTTLQWFLRQFGYETSLDPPMAIFFATLTHHISKRWNNGTKNTSG